VPRSSAQKPSFVHPARWHTQEHVGRCRAIKDVERLQSIGPGPAATADEPVVDLPLQSLAGSQTNGRRAPIASGHCKHAHLRWVHAQQPIDLAKDRPGCRQIPHLHTRLEGIGLPHDDLLEGRTQARRQREGRWGGVSASSFVPAAGLLRPQCPYQLNDSIHGTNHQARRRTTATELPAVPDSCRIVRGITGNTGEQDSGLQECNAAPPQVNRAHRLDHLGFPSSRRPLLCPRAPQSEEVPPEGDRCSRVPVLVDIAACLVELLMHVVD
jgi:hypothetical protein